jgi:hypothetical protein
MLQKNIKQNMKMEQTFQHKKYQVIKNAVSYDLANFILNYFLLKRDAVDFMYQHNLHSQSHIL